MIETIKTSVHSFAVWLVGLLGFGAEFANYVYILFISMLPVIELRGALPVAVALHLPFLPSFVVSILGNLLPVPFILLLITPFCNWLKKTRLFSWFPAFLEKKVSEKREKVERYAVWGLYLFVAIPLPGTGAWTGALIAALLDMRMKYSLPAIALGVVIAGFIVTGIAYGFLSFLAFLL